MFEVKKFANILFGLGANFKLPQGQINYYNQYLFEINIVTIRHKNTARENTIAQRGPGPTDICTTYNGE